MASEKAVAAGGLRIAVVGMRGLPAAYSGIERVGEELYPALAARGHNVTVFARPGFAAGVEATFQGVRVRELRGLRWSSVETLSQSVVALAKTTWAHEFDVVHLHALAPGLMAPVYRASNVPIVLTVHGLDWKRARWRGSGAIVLKCAERMAVHFADEIIVVSNELLEYFERKYGRCTTLIRNAVEVGHPSPNPGNMPARCRAEKPLFLYAGRLVPEKRVEDLLLAIRRCPPGHRLVIAGAGVGRYARRIEALAAGEARVRLAGVLSRADLYEFMRRATALVLASDLEGLPVVVLEALAHGLLVIASDIAPHRELQKMAPGLVTLYPVGDVEALAARLSAAGTIRRRESRPNQAVDCSWSVERMVEATDTVLRRAASRGCGASAPFV